MAGSLLSRCKEGGISLSSSTLEILPKLPSDILPGTQCAKRKCFTVLESSLVFARVQILPEKHRKHWYLNILFQNGSVKPFKAFGYEAKAAG